jgi:hypothetical protein
VPQTHLQNGPNNPEPLTDDQPREQVHDDREVEPALPRVDVGDIRHPRRVPPRDGELPLQQIGNQDGGFPTDQRRTR